MTRVLASMLFVAACGSVSVKEDAATGDGRQPDGASTDTNTPSCGAAGQTCCANNACSTGLACTTGDQVCRTAQLFVGGNDSAGNAVVAHGSGTSFTVDVLGAGNVVGIAGTSATDVWAVATGSNTASQTSFLRHWNGSAWSSPVNLGGFYYGIWGGAPNNYWAVNNGGGAIHYDGTAWSSSMSVASAVLTQVWGSSATDVWAIGQSTVAHWDGSGNWSSTTRTDYGVYTRMSMSGRKSTGEWVSGGESGNNPAALYRNAANLTVQSMPGCGDTRGVWVGVDDAWALTGPLIAGGSCVAQPTIAHLENGAWIDKGKLPNATGAAGMWGSSNRDIYVAGATSTGATLFHYDGTTWTAPFAPAATQASGLFTIWGTGGPN